MRGLLSRLLRKKEKGEISPERFVELVDRAFLSLNKSFEVQLRTFNNHLKQLDLQYQNIMKRIERIEEVLKIEIKKEESEE